MRTQHLRRISAWFIIFILIWSAPPPVFADQTLGVRHELPNGLVWLFSQQNSLPLVTVNLLIKGGVLRDPPGKAGLANLTALLLTKGTKTKSATQIAQELDFLGAKLSSHGEDDYNLLSLTVLKKDLAAGLQLFEDILKHPALAPEEIKRMVAQLKASFQSDADDPAIVASRAFFRRLYGDHPYGHPTKGTVDGLTAITRHDLVDFHARYYRPNNAILSIVGDLTLEEAQEWVGKIFGSWEALPVPDIQVPAPPPLNKKECQIINKNISQAHIIWGHLGMARRNQDFYAFQVMNYLLGGGGFASRLMDNIRENRGLVYNVVSSFNPGLETGAFAVSLETKNDKAKEAVAEVLHEIHRLRSTPVTAEELQDAKSYLIGSFPRKMDSLGKRAWLLNYVELYGLGLDYPSRYPELISRLTPTDIQQVAQKYLHPEAYLLVVVGKREQLPPLSGKTIQREGVASAP